MATNEQFKNIIADVTITATSNRTDDGFKQKNGGTKTFYFSPINEDERKKLIDFGMTEYTPEATIDEPNPRPFFVAKSIKDLKVFTGKEDFYTVDCSVSNTENYANKEGKQSTIALTHVTPIQKGINDFYRVSAIMGKEDFDVMFDTIKPTNPFEELFNN